MKKSVLLTPAIFIIFFLLNSFFVLKEKEAEEKVTEEKITEEGQSCIGLKLGHSWLIDPFAKDTVAKVGLNQTGILSIQEASNDRNVFGKRIYFSITIQRPNTFFNIPILEYMNISVQEVDLKTILKSCKEGDVIFLNISEPRKYDPSIQRINVEKIKPKGSKGNGC